MRADAMTLGSDEIRWWNIHETSQIMLIASAIAFSSVITDIAVNWQNNIIQQYISSMLLYSCEDSILFLRYVLNCFISLSFMFLHSHSIFTVYEESVVMVHSMM